VTELHHILRRRDLPTFVGLGRTQMDELIRRREFPRPICLSDNGRAVGWLKDEVAAWQQSRIAKRDGMGGDNG
jgi:prophage regulatory protein